MEKELLDFYQKGKDDNAIDLKLYDKYSVKNGLRNEDGTGVLVGLTKISDVVGYERINGIKTEANGKLIYRGYDLKELIDANENSTDLYEKVCFLLLFGYLPDDKELESFKQILGKRYKLPNDFLESQILRFPSPQLMNKLQQDVLMLYRYDATPEDDSIEHIIDQGLHLVCKIPSLMVCNYMSKIHYFNNESMYIHPVNPELSMAQNILMMLRPDKKVTPKEVEVLDTCLVLHADHGGGNNSTFTNVVMASTGTDLYSTFAGSIGSLKGPKHGGANLAVCKMMHQVIEAIGYSEDETAIRNVICRLLDKDFYDHSGLIYGMGHAVYTLSDPRSEILKQKAKALANEKGMMKEYQFYTHFEKIAKDEIYQRKHIHICSNVDFYSGFVYQMLDIPQDIYPLLFVCARAIGWVAHNIENKLYSGKIIRPATKYVGELKTLKEGNCNDKN